MDCNGRRPQKVCFQTKQSKAKRNKAKAKQSKATDDADGDAADHGADDHDHAADAHADDDDDHLRVACVFAAPRSHVTPGDAQQSTGEQRRDNAHVRSAKAHRLRSAVMRGPGPFRSVPSVS